MQHQALARFDLKTHPIQYRICDPPLGMEGKRFAEILYFDHPSDLQGKRMEETSNWV